MTWNGLNQIKQLQNGGITYALGLGKMDESKPITFQGGQNINCSFKLKENKVGFKVDGYDTRRALVIDPDLKWGTYFGGSGNESPNGEVIDNLNNIYIGGGTESKSGIATSGAYQTLLKGNSDCYLSKYNSNGSLLWSTYFGGKGDETFRDIAMDVSGNIYATGSADSASIATSGAFQTKNGGASDANLVKFNSKGYLLWATYFGGNQEDDGNAITVDQSGNTIITGKTLSYSGIASNGAYQSQNNGGVELFLSKFDSSGTLIWSTYYGGAADEDVFAIASFHDNIYITGSTSSKSSISKGNVHQKTLTGANVYIAKFNGAGNLVWGTYYGGTQSEWATGIVIDKYQQVYITGVTSDTLGIAKGNVFQNSSGSMG
jgi:hypothetical protein